MAHQQERGIALRLIVEQTGIKVGFAMLIRQAKALSGSILEDQKYFCPLDGEVTPSERDERHRRLGWRRHRRSSGIESRPATRKRQQECDEQDNSLHPRSMTGTFYYQTPRPHHSLPPPSK